MEKPSVEKEIVVVEKSQDKRGRRNDKVTSILSASDSVPDKQVRVRRKPVTSGTTLNSNADFASHSSNDEENPKEPEEKKVLEGRDVIKQMEKYYTFGIDEIFSIRVTSIFSGPARLRYRMLNNDHVKEIVDSMIRNPGHEPAIADLIPYSVDKESVLTYSNTPGEKRDFQIAARGGKIQFVAISGQHSSAAAKRILEWATVNTNVSDIAKKLTYRKSRILSASTPISVLA